MTAREESDDAQAVRLAGGRVRLRDFNATDADAASAIFGDDRVTRNLSFDSRSREQTIGLIDGIIARAGHRPRLEYYLAIVAPPQEGPVGFVRLGLGGVRAAKLGFAIHADHWGRGYASDASRVILDFGFERLALHRVSAAIGPGNAPSLTVVRRLGFTYEGRLRDHVFTNGEWRDSLLYSLLAVDRPERRALPEYS
jgi:[ribosomal protein S5]-alanine N-acetyltransferase